MSPSRILVVDDEEDIRELIHYTLTRDQYEVEMAADGEEALDKVQQWKPDLVVLDLMLPGMDGLEVCRRLRQDPHLTKVPVIMVTAKSEEVDEVIGLGMGADDYVTKPFSPRVLSARIKSLLRRLKQPVVDNHSILGDEQLRLDPERHEVTMDGEVVDLTPIEFGILHCLMKKPGRAFAREEIIRDVLGSEYMSERAIDVHVVALRKKLNESSRRVETVRGIGYRFRDTP